MVAPWFTHSGAVTSGVTGGTSDLPWVFDGELSFAGFDVERVRLTIEADNPALLFGATVTFTWDTGFPPASVTDLSSGDPVTSGVPVPVTGPFAVVNGVLGAGGAGSGGEYVTYSVTGPVAPDGTSTITVKAVTHTPIYLLVPATGDDTFGTIAPPGGIGADDGDLLIVALAKASTTTDPINGPSFSGGTTTFTLIAESVIAGVDTPYIHLATYYAIWDSGSTDTILVDYGAGSRSYYYANLVVLRDTAGVPFNAVTSSYAGTMSARPVTGALIDDTSPPAQLFAVEFNDASGATESDPGTPVDWPDKWRRYQPVSPSFQGLIGRDFSTSVVGAATGPTWPSIPGSVITTVFAIPVDPDLDPPGQQEIDVTGELVERNAGANVGLVAVGPRP